MSDPVFSRRDAVPFTPDGSPRSYLIAPLTFRERQAFRADLAREGGLYPPRDQMLEALRAAVAEIAPGNAHELTAAIDAASAAPDDAALQARLAAIEAACAAVPAYAEMLAARQRYLGMLPWVAARHGLRGWDGPGLPPFTRVRGLVPADLLDLLPGEEVEAVGWRASALMHPGADAEKNSAGLSPSPESPAPMPAA
jgi:hypothetical protein